MKPRTKFLKLATEEDFDACLYLTRQMYDHSHWVNSFFMPEKCRQVFDTYLSGDKTKLIIILLCDPDPYGIIIGVKQDLPFCDGTVSTELLWWVDENKKDIKGLLWLYEAFEDWSKRVRATYIQSGMLLDLCDLSKFYERRGYRRAEQSYFKEL